MPFPGWVRTQTPASGCAQHLTGLEGRFRALLVIMQVPAAQGEVILVLLCSSHLIHTTYLPRTPFPTGFFPWVSVKAGVHLIQVIVQQMSEVLP